LEEWKLLDGEIFLIRAIIIKSRQEITKGIAKMAGKGSKRRPTNEKKFRDNWDRIFSGNKSKKTA
jgi:hypothetical protein